MYTCHKAYYGIWIGNEGPSVMLSCVQYKFFFSKPVSHLTPSVSVCIVSFHSLYVANTLQQPEWWLNKSGFIVSITRALSEFIALKVTALMASVFLNWAKIPGYLNMVCWMRTSFVWHSIVYTITLRNFVVPTLSMVGDPLSGNGCGSPNHM